MISTSRNFFMENHGILRPYGSADSKTVNRMAKNVGIVVSFAPFQKAGWAYYWTRILFLVLLWPHQCKISVRKLKSCWRREPREFPKSSVAFITICGNHWRICKTYGRCSFLYQSTGRDCWLPSLPGII